MSLLGRDSFARDLLVLLLIGVIVASLFSLGLAMTTDKYFARAVKGVIGDYGQYDLIFQVRTDLCAETLQQLRQIVADRFPGSILRTGVSIAGKSTIFLGFAPPYRTRQVFESLGSYFGDLPGGAGYSIIAEPRLVLSGVPGGAREWLRRKLANLPGVDFVFASGDNLNLLVESADRIADVKAAVKKELRNYQLLEVRFPVDAPVPNLAALGGQLESALADLPGVELAMDVTRGGAASDTQYMAAALSEMRRFMIAYAARVKVTPARGARLLPGERLVLQGRASRPPQPGQDKDDRFVEIKLESVDANGTGQGLIVQGDASYIQDPTAYNLLAGDIVGERAGTVSIVDERAALTAALDEGTKLLRYVQTMADDPVWGEASGSLQAYQGILSEISGVQDLLRAIRDGAGMVTAAETRERLRQAARQIDGIADELEFLSATMARVKIAENKVASILDRLNVFQWFLRTRGSSQDLDQNPGGLGHRLLAADQGLTSLGENLRRKARQIDDFINRFNPFVQVLLSWGERANVLADQLEYFGGALQPGSKARQTFDNLISITDSTLARLQGFDALGVMRDMAQVKERLGILGGVDLEAIIGQMNYVRDSLPKLLDEEIGRSVGLIDRYLGGEIVPGERLQIMVNAGIDTPAAMALIRRLSGRSEADVLRLPLGALEPDFRGEVFRVLGEVRTTITALVLLALFILEFLLDQTAVIAMLRRRAAETSRLVGRHPLLARLASLLNPAWLYAAGFGAVWLQACFLLTGARLPLLSGWGAALIGACLGLLLGTLAERISPIDTEEVMAGESLGLPFVLIMREIVIPAGRPGLLQLLNRRRLIMRGGRRA